MADPLSPLVDLTGVQDRVTATRDSVDRLRSHRVLRRRSPDVSAESALRGAWASAAIAGSSASLAEVRNGAAAEDPLVQGALRVQAEIAAVVDTWPRAPRQVLARLHAVAAADLVPGEMLGRPRPSTEVTARLDLLVGVLGTTSAPALVIAAVVHGELLAVDAFAPVSGIVARAAVRLTLISRGLDPKGLVVVEVGHRELRPAYERALEAYRSNDVAPWLHHQADAVLAGTAEATAICEALARG